MTYSVGDQLPALSAPTLDRLRIAYMAVAMRDPNLVHLEEEYAQQSGLPGVIGHGTFTVAYMCDVVTRTAGVAALRDFDFSITAPIFVGDVVTVNGEITAVEASSRFGTMVSVAVTATTQAGTVVGKGSAAFVGEAP